MFELMVEDHFSAANQVSGYEYELAPDRLHGHNFRVQLYAESTHLNTANMVPATQRLTIALQEVINDFHMTCLNDFPAFHGQSTSVENTTRYVYQRIKKAVPELSKVIIFENTTQSITYHATHTA